MVSGEQTATGGEEAERLGTAEAEEGKSPKKYEEYYSDLLYRLLPAIYQNKDNKEDGKPLKRFLKVLAGQAALMRRDIDGLWSDFFINTCKTSLIPYIGDLVGTNLVLNEAARNRSDVKRTIFWRKRKGTLLALEDLANFITVWNARAIEFFQILVWSQNLNSLKFNHVQTPDMSNSIALDKIYTADDSACHNIDVRNPDQSLGWYNIKNVGFYFSRQQVFRIQNGSPLEVSGGLDPALAGQRFYFDPPWKPFFVDNKLLQLYDKEETKMPSSLYDKLTRRPIRMADFSADPYEYFGDDRGMSVNIYNILAAYQKQEGIENLERFAGRVSTADTKFLQFERLDSSNGIWLLEPRKFGIPRWNFEISIIDWKISNSTTTFTVLGKINTSDPASFEKQQEVQPSDKGYTVVKVKIDNSSEPGVFSDTIIGIKRDAQNEAADSVESRFANVLYVYLPEVFLASGEEIYLLIAEDGTTFYTVTNNSNKSHKGEPHLYPKSNPDHEIIRKMENTARRSLGQIFPARFMSNSYFPANGFLKLNRDHGITVPDKSRVLGHFIITAYSKSSKAKSLVPLGTLDTSVGTGKYEMYEPDTEAGKDELVIAQEDGTLVLSVIPVENSGSGSGTNVVFPISEIILTNKSNQSLLVYIPEIGGSESEMNERYRWDMDGTIKMIKYFYPADDGSVYFCSPEDTKLLLQQQQQRTVFSPRNVARKSAGQILPMAEQVPIRFRVPVAHAMGKDSAEFTPLQGELAIDPVRGIFCFSAEDFSGQNASAKGSISVSYNYGFPAAIGAGSYDRTVFYYGDDDMAELKKYARFRKPTLWVTKSLDVADKEANENIIFDTLKKALEAVKGMEEEVIIQIQDSSLYIEDAFDFQMHSVKNLTVQAANGQRPVILMRNSGLNIMCNNLKSLTLNGLEIISYDASITAISSATATTTTDSADSTIFKVSGKVDEMHIISCTINPSLNALRLELDDGSDGDTDESAFLDLTIDRSIIGGIDVGNARVNFKINNSIIDNLDKDALVGSRIGCNLDRSTIVGNVSINTLYASETIFEGLVMIKNRQEGCVRYSRYTQNSNLFDWNKIKEQPNETDNNKLKDFLTRNFDETQWVKDADITNDGKTISIKTSQPSSPKSIMLNLNSEKDSVDFVLDDKTYHFIAKSKGATELDIFAYSVFPRLYKCTDVTPLFNSRRPWDPHYMQLHVKCDEHILEGAENKSEMGAYYYGYYSLAVTNFRIKLREYLPLMLKPAIIMEDK